MDNYIHTRRLAEFLAMDNMGAVELKRTVEKTVPRELSYHDYDGKVVNARELLISEGIQGSTLIPTEIYATVIEGTEPVKCMRNVLPQIAMKGMVTQMPYGEAGTYAPIVAEGAEIPVEDQTYSSITFTAKKYGVRPLITNEMIDDALFDIVAGEIRKAGSRMENTLNRVALYEVIDHHGNEVTSVTSTPLAKAISLQAAMIGDDVTPTDLVMCPGAVGLGMAEAFGKSGAMIGDKVAMQGNFGNFIGLNVHMLGVSALLSPSSHIWRATTGSDVEAFMIDRSRAAFIGMRQDIKVEQYADTIRQMQGVTLSMRFDVQALGGSTVDAIGTLAY